MSRFVQDADVPCRLTCLAEAPGTETEEVLTVGLVVTKNGLNGDARIRTKSLYKIIDGVSKQA
jgi:hypothetical protein